MPAWLLWPIAMTTPMIPVQTAICSGGVSRIAYVGFDRSVLGFEERGSPSGMSFRGDVPVVEIWSVCSEFGFLYR